MDRNSIIGLVVIFVILIGFSYLNKPSQEQLEAAKRRSDSLALVKSELDRAAQEQEALALQNQESSRLESNEQEKPLQNSLFAQAVNGEEKLITLENDLVSLQISTKGGAIHSAEIKGYKKYNEEPLVLFNNKNNVFGLQFWGNNNNVETNKLYFSPDRSESVIVAREGASQTLTMRLAAGESSFIDYVYTIHHGSHIIDFDIKFTNMGNVFQPNINAIDLNWEMYSPQLEKNAEKESEFTTIAYHFASGDFEELNNRNDEVDEDVDNRLKWIGYKQQFFSTFLISDDNFLNARLSSSKLLDGENIKRLSSRIAIPIDNPNQGEHSMKMYFGPNHYKTLESYEHGFEEVVPLGSWIIRWINKYIIIFLFDLLDNKIANYGVIILLLTLIIKIVLFPLTYKSYLSQAKMRVLKPRIDALNAKFTKKEDAMKKQQATMDLYKKAGVNPMGGCLPMLIQFPFLIAMFRFFPASFELRQKGFLWAQDLSSYDSIFDLPFTIPFYGDHVSLFTLLMAVTMFLSTKMTSGQMADNNAQMPGMKFMMLYMMPIMMLFLFNSFPSGLSYYYFLSNVVTLGQTMLIRSTVNDADILKKLDQNAKKPQKKSKFQARLEAMAKQQQTQGKSKK